MAQPGGPSSTPLATLSEYEPGPGTCGPAGEAWPLLPQRCSSLALLGHVQPAGKSCADLVVSQARPPGQWEGWRWGVAWVTKGGWETLLRVGAFLTSFEGEIFSTYQTTRVIHCRKMSKYVLAKRKQILFITHPTNHHKYYKATLSF